MRIYLRKFRHNSHPARGEKNGKIYSTWNFGTRQIKQNGRINNGQVINADKSCFSRPGENTLEQESKEAGIGMYGEVSPGVYWMETGKGISRANVYFVRTGSSWVLMDAAMANCGRLIRKTAESLFGANSRPTSILLTHNHPDHAGSALELARLWDCPIYVHPDELPYVAIEDLQTIEKYANPLDRWIILPLLRFSPHRAVVHPHQRCRSSHNGLLSSRGG